MSSESSITFDQFLTLTFFKKIIKSTDIQDDDSYLEWVDAANLEVHKRIFPYIDTPIGSGSQYFSRCTKAALSYALSLLAEDNELLTKSTAYEVKFEAKMESIVKELRATRTNRTKTVLVSSDVRDRKVILPTQTDLFVIEEFGWYTMATVYTLNDLGRVFNFTLPTTITPTNVVSQKIVFYKPLGIRFEETATRADAVVTFDNDTLPSILDKTGKWEYTAKVTLNDGDILEVPERLVFWVV